MTDDKTPRDFNLLGEIRFDDPIQQALDVYECSRCGCLVVTTSRHLC